MTVGPLICEEGKICFQINRFQIYRNIFEQLIFYIMSGSEKIATL